MTETVSNPHDTFFKHYLGQPGVAQDFLRHHLPAEISELLEWEQLRLEKDTFVDEQLRSYFSDLIYSTVTKTATPVRLALLVEHKSYPDEWVDFQVLRYQVGYWVREMEAIQAAVQSAEKGKPKRTKRRRTLTRSW